MFVDEAFGAEEAKPASAAGPSAQWESLGTQAERSKENTLQPKKWSDVKVGVVQMVSSSRVAPATAHSLPLLVCLLCRFLKRRGWFTMHRRRSWMCLWMKNS